MKIDERNESLSERNVDDVAASVIGEFAEFCRIPRESGSEEKITEYLKERLTAGGFTPVTDGSGNLICDIPASPGCENSPLTVLQGHTDMVCGGRRFLFTGKRSGDLADPPGRKERKRYSLHLMEGLLWGRTVE